MVSVKLCPCAIGTSHDWGLRGRGAALHVSPRCLQSSLCSGVSWAPSQHWADQNALQCPEDISVHIILAKFYTAITLRPWTTVPGFYIGSWPANLLPKGPESKHVWLCRPTLIQGKRTLVQTACTDMGGATCQNFMMALGCKFHVVIHGSCNTILLKFPNHLKPYKTFSAWGLYKTSKGHGTSWFPTIFYMHTGPGSTTSFSFFYWGMTYLTCANLK